MATALTYEQDYRAITDLFQLADDLVMTVEHEAIEDKEAQLDLVEPVVHTVAESTDVLSEEFFVLLEGKPSRKKAAKNRIENALRKMYMAITEYAEQVKDAGEAVKRVTDPMINRIKRQIEMVVATLVQFVNLSLDLIMQKHDIDELRLRQERIASMLQHTQHMN